MAECRDASSPGEEAGPLARALRATAAGTARAQAWRDYIAHTGACSACRIDGVDCVEAAQLRQVWRDTH